MVGLFDLVTEDIPAVCKCEIDLLLTPAKIQIAKRWRGAGIPPTIKSWSDEVRTFLMMDRITTQMLTNSIVSETFQERWLSFILHRDVTKAIGPD